MSELETGPLTGSAAQDQRGLASYPAPKASVLGAEFEQGFKSSILPQAVRTLKDPFELEQQEEAGSSGVVGYPTYKPSPAASPMLSAKEANEQYRGFGMTPFTLPVSEAVAKRLYDYNTDRQEREDIASRSSGEFGSGAVARFFAGALGSAVDPVNLGSMFIPFVGEARVSGLMANAGASGLARAGARAQVGLIEGAAGTALTEGLNIPLTQANQQQVHYGDIPLNILGGGVIGGGLHAAAGAGGDALGRMFRNKDTSVAILNSVVEDLMAGKKADPAALVNLALKMDHETRLKEITDLRRMIDAEGTPLHVVEVLQKHVDAIIDEIKAPDIHTLARREDPQVFARLDDLAQREKFNQEALAEHQTERARQAELAAPHRQAVEDVKARLERGEDTPKSAAAVNEKLAKLEEERTAFIAEHTKGETPTTTLLKAAMERLAEERAALTERVARAYDAGEGKLPPEAPRGEQPSEAPKRATPEEVDARTKADNAALFLEREALEGKLAKQQEFLSRLDEAHLADMETAAPHAARIATLTESIRKWTEAGSTSNRKLLEAWKTELGKLRAEREEFLRRNAKRPESATTRRVEALEREKQALTDKIRAARAKAELDLQPKVPAHETAYHSGTSAVIEKAIKDLDIRIETQQLAEAIAEHRPNEHPLESLIRVLDREKESIYAHEPKATSVSQETSGGPTALGIDQPRRPESRGRSELDAELSEAGGSADESLASYLSRRDGPDARDVSDLAESRRLLKRDNGPPEMTGADGDGERLVEYYRKEAENLAIQNASDLENGRLSREDAARFTAAQEAVRQSENDANAMREAVACMLGRGII